MAEESSKNHKKVNTWCRGINLFGDHRGQLLLNKAETSQEGDGQSNKLTTNGHVKFVLLCKIYAQCNMFFLLSIWHVLPILPVFLRLFGKLSIFWAMSVYFGLKPCLFHVWLDEDKQIALHCRSAKVICFALLKGIIVLFYVTQ